MQLAQAEAEGRAVGEVSVLGPSLALELSWALLTASKDPLPAHQVAVSSLYTERPELAEAVRRFWGDGMACFSEIEVLSIWAGALEVTDFEELAAKLENGTETVPLDISLESETEGDRAIILERLGALRRSPARRRRWLELLGEVWRGLDVVWRQDGVAQVQRAAALARERLARGSDWTALVGHQCDVFQAHVPDILERQRAGRSVHLAPCAFFGQAMYVETPWTILVGMGAGGADTASRARTADVARRLRAVADPTRLAMLDFLADGPHSVGDIARSFSLAQPTVSSHVKHLREAGLVTAERRGARIDVSLDRNAVEALATELGTLLSR
jgi:ArsR family transcriptional regulator